MNGDKVKQFPCTNNEINLLLKILSKSVPSKEEEAIVVGLVNRLEFILRLN